MDGDKKDVICVLCMKMLEDNAAFALNSNAYDFPMVINDMINYCIGINIPIDDDYFPHHSCTECARLLISFSKYKQSCSENYENLTKKRREVDLKSKVENTEENDCKAFIHDEVMIKEEFNRDDGACDDIWMQEMDFQNDYSVKIKNEHSVVLDQSENSTDLEDENTSAAPAVESDSQGLEEANLAETVNICGKMDGLPSTSLTLTPPKREAAELASANVLPEKSRKAYLTEYVSFNKWRSEKKVGAVSESVLLAYFSELSEKYKPSTLWRTYSILKSTLCSHENVKIEKYGKLQAFLKLKSEGFEAKKASVFTPEEIQKFINTAPNELYFPTKVALIMGVMGACRSGELYSMKLSDIQDVGKACIIRIPNAKTKIARTFTITDNFYQICKQYINNRDAVEQDFVFLQYRKGTCTNHRVGINSFIKMGKDIAKFLKLPNAETYSGHSFRRSSATILTDAGGDLQSLKGRGGRKWKAT